MWAGSPAHSGLSGVEQPGLLNILQREFHEPHWLQGRVEVGDAHRVFTVGGSWRQEVDLKLGFVAVLAWGAGLPSVLHPGQDAAFHRRQR